MKILCVSPPLFDGRYFVLEECCWNLLTYRIFPTHVFNAAASFRTQGHEVDYRNFTFDDLEDEREITAYDVVYVPIVWRFVGELHRFLLRARDWGAVYNRKLVFAVEPRGYVPHARLLLGAEFDYVPFAEAFQSDTSLPRDLVRKRGHAEKHDGYFYQISTGCRSQCKFCTWAGTETKLKNPEIVADDIGFLAKHTSASWRNHGVGDNFNLLSAQITADKAWVEAFCARKARVAPEVRFQSDVSPHTLDEEVLLRLKDAGLVAVFMGVESFVDSCLQKLGKPYRSRQIEDALLLLAKHGICVTIPLRYGYGETAEEVLANQSVIRRLAAAGVRPVAVRVGAIWYWEGTRFRQETPVSKLRQCNKYSVPIYSRRDCGQRREEWRTVRATMKELGWCNGS